MRVADIGRLEHKSNIEIDSAKTYYEHVKLIKSI